MIRVVAAVIDLARVQAGQAVAAEDQRLVPLQAVGEPALMHGLRVVPVTFRPVGYDPATGEGSCVNTFGGYGLGIDTNGYVWASLWESGIAKVSPDGVVEPGLARQRFERDSTTATAADCHLGYGHRQSTVAQVVAGRDQTGTDCGM